MLSIILFVCKNIFFLFKVRHIEEYNFIFNQNFVNETKKNTYLRLLYNMFENKSLMTIITNNKFKSD